MPYNIKLENCDKLEEGVILSKDATPIIKEILKNSLVFETPNRISPFYKFDGRVFDPATIYEMASKALNSIESKLSKTKLLKKLPDETQNQMILLSTLALLTIESNPFFYPETCPLESQYAH